MFAKDERHKSSAILTQPSLMKPRAKHRGRQRGKKLSLLAAGTLFCFVLVEVALRLTGLDKARVWEPHPELGWQHVPRSRQHWTEEGDGWIEINRLGYRDRDRELAKSPDVYRIAVFGDSMTEGVQVNLRETYCYLLEESLRRQGIPAEVINFAVNGYGPVQELLLFQRESARYRPDCVILSLFLDNDVADCHPDLTTHQNGPPFVSSFDDEGLHFDFSKAEQSYSQYHVEPIYAFRKYSAVYRLVADQRTRWGRRSESRASGNTVPRRFLLYKEPIEPKWEEAWNTLERVLIEFAKGASDHQCGFGVVSVPAGQVVNPTAWERILESHPAMSEIKWDLEGPERRLRAFADEHGILLLQSSGLYERAPEGSQLFFGDVGHFTRHGHQLIAQVIEEFMHDNRLLPEVQSRNVANSSQASSL